MPPRRELVAFAIVLGALAGGSLGECLVGGKVLSPGDTLFVSATFRDVKGPDYQPANRLLTDPVLQFEPWLEFNRAMLRRGRLPLWNDLAGCGSPHLASSQSAVFDPFHLIAYLGKLPYALAWIAFARLWVAGLGMFLLARSWGLGPWGRWFAGLAFPLCGFLTVWLLYPVTAAAVWMPWLLWMSDRVLERPEPRRVGMLALVVGAVLLAGHIQTSAHVLLAAGCYVAWRVFPRFRGLGAWSLGVALGLGIAAATILPLACYLAKSPVWADRASEKPSVWTLSRPRLLDAVCTAVPYAFGSQRRGHPNLARALGVHNLNESAGGYAGLAALIWLAPRAWRVRKTNPRIGFLAALAVFGFLAGFGFPPVANLLRALPVLDVMDQRRLTLWLAFGLTMLGGIGLDHLDELGARPRGFGPSTWVAVALLLCLGAATVPRFGPTLRARAEAHYAKTARSTPGADPDLYQRRADRQVIQALDHVPRQWRLTAAELAGLAALAALARRGWVSWDVARLGLLGLTVAELIGFGHGLNPAIDRRDDRPVPEVLARLRAEVSRSGRVLGIGEELPPNVAMRYGLADPRNYDSIELARNLDWFDPLYEPEPGRTARTSRRTINWEGVARARARLREAGVVAVVAATPPPETLGARVERVGGAWIARLDAEPLIATADHELPASASIDNGSIDLAIHCKHETTLIVRQTFDAGWRAEVDGRPAAVAPYLKTFLSLPLASGLHRVVLVYDPVEVRVGSAVSLGAMTMAVFALTGFRPVRSTRFPRRGLGASRAVGLESDL